MQINTFPDGRIELVRDNATEVWPNMRKLVETFGWNLEDYKLSFHDKKFTASHANLDKRVVLAIEPEGDKAFFSERAYCYEEGNRG